MRNRRNLYRVLHVQSDAPAAVLKSSYRALMLSLEMHPDRGGEHWNAAAINEAYATLSDPVRRAEYDRTLDLAPQAGRRREGGDDAQPSPAGDHHPRSANPAERCLFCGSTRAATGAAPDLMICRECRSPLTPAGVPELEASGRRAASRVLRQGGIRYYTDWPQPVGHQGQIVDVSPTGLRFEGSAPVALFRILKVEGPLLDAVVRVVSSSELVGRFTAGAQFYTVQFHSPHGTFLSTRA